MEQWVSMTKETYVLIVLPKIALVDLIVYDCFFSQRLVHMLNYTILLMYIRHGSPIFIPCS